MYFYYRTECRPKCRLQGGLRCSSCKSSRRTENFRFARFYSCDLTLTVIFFLYRFFIAEYCLPLVRVGGLFVAAKGYDPQVYFTFRSFFRISNLHSRVDFVLYTYLILYVLFWAGRNSKCTKCHSFAGRFRNKTMRWYGFLLHISYHHVFQSFSWIIIL